MAIRVLVPTPLLTLTSGQREIEIDLKNIKFSELLTELCKRYPGFHERLYLRGKLNRFVNYYVSGEDIRFLNGENTLLVGDEEVSLIAAIAGG